MVVGCSVDRFGYLPIRNDFEFIVLFVQVAAVLRAWAVLRINLVWYPILFCRASGSLAVRQAGGSSRPDYGNAGRLVGDRLADRPGVRCVSIGPTDVL